MLASLPMCLHLQIDFCSRVTQRSGTGRISASGECGHCLIEHTRFTIGRVLVQIDFGVVTCMFMFVCKVEVEAVPVCGCASVCVCVSVSVCVCLCVFRARCHFCCACHFRLRSQSLSRFR